MGMTAGTTAWLDRAKSGRELLTIKSPFGSTAAETFRVNREGRLVSEPKPRGSAPNPALAAWQGVGSKPDPTPSHGALSLRRRQGSAAPGAHPFGARLRLRSACGFRACP